MGVRVTDMVTVALYDSVTGLAFGPTILGGESEANDFLVWLEDRGVDDPRSVPADTLDEYYNAFGIAQTLAYEQEAKAAS